jgi:hypothetical protein
MTFELFTVLGIATAGTCLQALRVIATLAVIYRPPTMSMCYVFQLDIVLKLIILALVVADGDLALFWRCCVTTY